MGGLILIGGGEGVICVRTWTGQSFDDDWLAARVRK
jgi:hypothetical protein